ncbi:uncharacterized protein [Neodiprion pinetum]|uniref:uncharacterized protein n=1 Tax=Neodiprion pinetum TaxID=441929 RepID=UPI00371748B5
MDYGDWATASWIIRRLVLFRCGGGTLTSFPPYEPETSLALVQKHRVTWMALKSSQIRQLYDCQAIVGYDLSSLKMVSAPSTGSALHSAIGSKYDSLRERLPATRIIITGRTIADVVPV